MAITVPVACIDGDSCILGFPRFFSVSKVVSGMLLIKKSFAVFSLRVSLSSVLQDVIESVVPKDIAKKYGMFDIKV